MFVMFEQCFEPAGFYACVPLLVWASNFHLRKKMKNTGTIAFVVRLDMV